MLFFFNLTAAHADSYRGQVAPPADLLVFEKVHDYDFIFLEDAGYTSKPGAPSLPLLQVNVALPTDAQVSDVRVVELKTRFLEGTFNILPCSEPIHIGARPEGEPLVRDPTVYGADALYPGEHVKIEGAWDLAGQDFVTLSLYPVQYNPVSGKVVATTSIEFEVQYEAPAGATRETYNFSERTRAYYLDMLKGMAINPDDVPPLPDHVPSATTALPAGNYDYVIITTAALEGAFKPLADWRTQRGLPAQVKTTSWIYSNYTGTTNQLKIRNFIKDANSTWGTIYFLMGGDSAYVPYHTKTIDGDNIPNDTYYGDHDGDWKYEVWVGRAPVASIGQVNALVNKIFTYEQNPPSSYGNKVFFMGFNADSGTPSENCKKTIKNNYVPSYAAFVKEYDSESGGHENDVKNYLNAGQNLINHCDHADTTVIGVGSYYHGTWLSLAEAQTINCGTKYGNLYSLGCYPGNFPKSCWGEVYIRDDQGGITFTGNSRYGWYQWGNTNTLSHKYDQKWWQVLYQDNAYRAGETCGAHLNKYYPSSTTYRYIFTELNLLGDPALHYWTKNPSAIAVTYDNEINTGAQSYNVTVKFGTTPLSGALVCLWKGDEVYATKTTNSSGIAGFSINPATAGEMLVTATKQNYRCHMGSVTVTGGTGGPAITAIAPTMGPEAGATAVTVTGSNFTTYPVTAVKIGNDYCTNVQVVNSSTIHCDTPAGVNGWWDVEVSNVNGSDTLPACWRYFPVTGNPFNGTNVNTKSLNTPANVVMIISGNPWTPYYAFFSFEGGPTPTPYGQMGLGASFIHLLSGSIGGTGFVYIPFHFESGYGPVDFYIHTLGVNGAGHGVWAYGGGNPNGTGSIPFHLNN
jgi:hypothetical protein